RQHLSDTSKRISASAFEGKFTGPVIFTPECLYQFLAMLLGNYASDSVILDGTSLWLNKIGERVASPALTLSNLPNDPRIVMGESWTGDGFRSEYIVIIDQGILKTHLLGLYVARKTGRPVTRNTDSALIVNPGNTSLDTIIRGIDRGLLVGSFSGGHPGTNGDFSGVAKSAFLIENGHLSHAVSETMISGNLGEIFRNIRAISSETVENGSTVLPYMAVEGIVVSGK
ncbi:MAG: TldD/PmbA family protein, partial [Clostridia bacterium]|nr:TldD/PmbA family protein [Clostridia bacterium]